MAFDEFRRPEPVYIPRNESNYFTSTILSTGAEGITSGSTINVIGLRNITAFIQRTVSTTAIELEVSPNGTTWYNWETFPAVALPAGGEFTSQDAFISGATFAYVRAVPNVSATFTSAAVVRLNGFAR